MNIYEKSLNMSNSHEVDDERLTRIILSYTADLVENGDQAIMMTDKSLLDAYGLFVRELVVRFNETRLRTFCFDCWKMNGNMETKEIHATCEEHAILKFEKENEDYGYDPPYII